jgi:hypothetical protein
LRENGLAGSWNNATTATAPTIPSAAILVLRINSSSLRAPVERVLTQYLPDRAKLLLEAVARGAVARLGRRVLPRVEIRFSACLIPHDRVSLLETTRMCEYEE